MTDNDGIVLESASGKLIARRPTSKANFCQHGMLIFYIFHHKINCVQELPSAIGENERLSRRRRSLMRVRKEQRWRHHLHQRSRRYIHPRQMSVAVFADYTLYRWFQQFPNKGFISIENYIQDILGISSIIMRHPSLEQDISIELVDITVIQNRKGLTITEH